MKIIKSLCSILGGNHPCISAGVLSDIGCSRENNEDNYLLGKYINTDSADRSEAAVGPEYIVGGFVAAVFDGMGGGEAGELASAAAARSLRDRLPQLQKRCSRAEIDEYVRAGLCEGNAKIVEMQENRRICGSTGTVLCLRDKEFKIFHLGDSRAYLRREGTLFQLSRDQTLAQMKIEMDIYDYDDPRSEAEKHQLTDFLGRAKNREQFRTEESGWSPVQKGDMFLLCSDGLYDACDDGCLSRCLSEACDAPGAVKALVTEALERGATDNVTAIVVQLN